MIYEAESSKLRTIARGNPSFIWTKHALVEMEKDDIAKIDIVNLLKRCIVTLIEYRKEEHWRAEGKDINGRRIEVVLVLYENKIKIKIITAWSK